jgi:WD40 repeat protein
MKRLKRIGMGLAAGFILATALAGPMDTVQAQIDPTAQGTGWAQTRPVDLSAVRSHLQARNWQAADEETRRVLQGFVHPNGDLFGHPLAANIPPEVLQTLDQLWLEASGGRFGFSVQQRIWEEVRAQNPSDTAIAAKAFGDRVGWTRPQRDPNNFVAPDWLTEPELNYSQTAPVGHLPWAGVDWERIESMITAQSCGSCTIDALYLQGERFGRYLPELFNWTVTALTQPLPAAGSWERPRLAHSINLRSLYSNPNCPVNTPASAVSPDGSVIAISSYSYERSCSSDNNSTLALWNAQSGTRRITLLRGQATEAWNYSGTDQEPRGESDRIVGDVANAIAFTPDSRLVAAGLSNGTIRLWTTERGEAVRTLSGHRYAVRAIAISADGQVLASASSDQTIKLWNLQTGQLLRTITMDTSDGIVHTLVISPNGQRLATATHRNTVQLWDASSGQLVRTFVDEAINLPPQMPISFSPDSQRVATADTDNSIKLWNATTGVRLITLKGHNEPVQHLTFSPDGQRLASSDGKSARVWNLQTYETAHTLGLIQSAGHPIMPTNLGNIAFSRDGRVLAANALLLPLVQSEPIPQQGLALFDVATGRTLHHIHGVAQFQFSPDGQFIVARGQNMQVWQPYQSLVSNQRPSR